MTRGPLWVGLLLATSLLGVARLQPRLAAQVHEVKQGTDVYLLPPPSEIRALSLGYRAAAADGTWAKLIVEYGTHWAEKRTFEDAPKYMEAILALDPAYPLVYKYAETLIVFRPPVGTLKDWYVARAMLERGTRERPYDADVWLHYGQFLAFAAPTWVKDQAELDRYREEGARAIVHAVELGADPDRSITAATLLSRYGKRDAAINELRRAFVLADDDEGRRQIAQKLAVLGATPDREEIEHDMRAIESRWRDEFGFLSRGSYMLLGPMTDPVRCAGRPTAAECPRTWTDVLENTP
jgi:tetratricopeptide (TPR) repeat protein